MQTPLFIFSLPRAGSTLLQRVLMSHSEIHSISEPWILLPFIYSTKEQGTLSEYSSQTATTGICDFIDNLPNKKEDYKEAQRKFITELYAKQCKKKERYFLDKTPRYYLIIDEIVDLFPNAKFIFLFRNPIHIYASIVNTWGNGRFKNIITTYDDLIKGTKKLSEAYIKYKQKSYALKYEDFILNPEAKLVEIFKYLEIPNQNDLLASFSKQDTKGTLGDPTGVNKYRSISDKSLQSWETVFNATLRKKFATSMLNKLDNEDLLCQGYDKKEILLRLKALNNKKNTLFIRDLIDYSLNQTVRGFKLYLFVNKKFKWIKKESLS
jgi:Sulfotransferase family